MTRLGVISAYPEEDWHSARLIQACRAAGVAAVVLDPGDFAVECVARDGLGEVRIRAAIEDVGRFDAFLMPRAIGERGDPDVQLEIYRAMEREGALLINRVEALLSAIDKFRTTHLLMRTGVPTPAVVVAQRPEDAEAALETMGDLVVKPVYGSLGIGIERVKGRSKASRVMLARLLRTRGALYLQEYVGDPRGARDIRAFVIGGRVEAAIVREAPAGEFRTNIHLGGAARAIELSPEAELIATRAASVLGLEYAGVDLVEGEEGPLVLEINGTPHWEGIYRATGRDMAPAIVAWACQRAELRARRFAPPDEGNVARLN